MFFVYNENERGSGGGFNPANFDPNKCLNELQKATQEWEKINE